MRNLISFAALAVIALARATHVYAQAPGVTPLVEPGAPAVAHADAYRSQTLLADGVVVAMVVLAVHDVGGSGEEEFPLLLGTYLLGAPIVHAAHRRVGRAFASLGLRVALPILGGVIGQHFARHPCAGVDLDLQATCDESFPSDAMALGILAGLVSASALDSAVLARGYELGPVTRIAPTVSAGPNGFSFGLGGAF